MYLIILFIAYIIISYGIYIYISIKQYIKRCKKWNNIISIVTNQSKLNESNYNLDLAIYSIINDNVEYKPIYDER